MKLTSYTDYALRCLQFAALHAPSLVRVEDISRAHGISRPHVVKAVHQLGRDGFLETRRGRNGGFQLAIPADQITVGSVVRTTEAGFNIAECFDRETNTCPLIDACGLSQTMNRAVSAFLDVLDATTIADITMNPKTLMDRLAPEAGVRARDVA